MKSAFIYVSAIVIWMGLLSLGASSLYASTDETTVEIQNIDDRVRATVTSPPKPIPPPVEPRTLEKPILAVEDTTIGVAGQSTKLVGKGTDAAVDTVQKVGDSFFANFFKLLDFSRRDQTNKN